MEGCVDFERMPGPRMTTQSLAVLAIFLSNPTLERHGFDLSSQAGLKSGTLYPLLARLERAGWLTSRWEDVDPHAAGRPRRRLYLLTAHGAEAAKSELEAQLQALSRGAGPAQPSRKLGLA
jgi:PadR family transcriptional regulator PadR